MEDTTRASHPHHRFVAQRSDFPAIHRVPAPATPPPRTSGNSEFDNVRLTDSNSSFFLLLSYGEYESAWAFLADIRQSENRHYMLGSAG